MAMATKLFDFNKGGKDATAYQVLTVNGRPFIGGPLAIQRQHELFEQEAVVEDRGEYTCLPLSGDTLMPLTFQTWRAVNRGRVELLDESFMGSTSSPSGAETWFSCTPVGGVRNVFENTMGDIAIRVFFMTSLRRGDSYGRLPADRRTVLIMDPDAFLVWFKDEIIQFLTTTFRATITHDDIVVSSSVDPVKPDATCVMDPRFNRGFHSHKLTVRHLVLRNAAERVVFKQAVQAYFGPLCDASAYDPNAHVILAGSAFLPGTRFCSETPFSGSAIDGAVTLVPAHARGMDVSVQRDGAVPDFVRDFHLAGEFTWSAAGPYAACGSRAGWTCPFGKHTGATVRLRNDKGRLFLDCLGPRRDVAMLTTQDGKQVPVSRLGATRCGTVPLGSISPSQFLLPASIHLPAPDGRHIDPASVPRMPSCVVVKCAIGSGKTSAAFQEVVSVIRAGGRVVYGSHLVETVRIMAADFNARLKVSGLPTFAFYQDDRRLSGNVAFCVMSAADVDTETPIDLFIWDEAESGLFQMVSLSTHKGCPLEAMIKVMLRSRRILLLDADASDAVAMATRLAGREAVVVDTDAAPFAGATMTVHAAYGKGGFAVHCQLETLVSIILKAQRGVAVVCTTVQDVDLVRAYLLGRDVEVDTIIGKDSDEAREKFMGLFTGPRSEVGRPHVFIYSPVVGPAVSNTWIDVVCALTRSRTVTMHTHCQALWRARKATEFHVFPLEEGILIGGLPRLATEILNDSADIPDAMRLDIGRAEVRTHVAMEQLRGKTFYDCFYTRPHVDDEGRMTKVTRCVLDNPAPLATFREACREACVNAANGRAGAFNARLEELAASVPDDYRDVGDDVGRAKLWLQARAVLERKNRQRLILDHIRTQATRNGVRVEPVDVRLVEDDSESRAFLRDARFAAMALTSLRAVEAFDVHVRPRLMEDGTPDASLMDSFRAAVANTRPGRPMRVPRDILDDFDFLGDFETPFTNTLVQLISGTELVDDDDVGALAMWATPVVSLGGAFVSKVVLRAGAKIQQYLDELRAGQEKPKVVKLREAIQRLVRAINPAVAEFTRYKRLLLLHGTLDTAEKTAAVKTRMDRLTLLDDLLGAVAQKGDDRARIVGIDGVVISHMYKNIDAVTNRLANLDDEAARIKAFEVFTARYPTAKKMPERFQYVLQMALNEVHGATFSVTHGEGGGTRPGYAVRADGMTREIDIELLTASTAELQKAVDLWSALWAPKRKQREEHPAATVADPRPRRHR